MAEILDVLRNLAMILEKNSIKYVVIGGIAAIINGNARITSDIDLIIQSEPNIAQKIISAFQNTEFDIMEEQLKMALNEGVNASIFSKSTIIRLDLKLAKNSDEKEVLEQAVEVEFQGIKLKIASKEQILYGKVLYMGDISDLDDNEILDFNDARDFIKVYKSAPDIDLNWIKQKVKRKGLETTLNRLLKVANNVKL